MTIAKELTKSIAKKRAEEEEDVRSFSQVRIIDTIKMERSSMQRRTQLIYMVKMSFFTMLVGALSFMGAFVFRDFFLALFKTTLQNAGMPRLLTDVIYLLLVMVVAVPALTLVSWAKAKEELKMIKGDIKNVLHIPKNKNELHTSQRLFQ